MNQGNLNPIDSTLFHRNDALRQLVERYEVGELTDEEFTELKRQILRDGAIATGFRAAHIDMIIGTYAVPNDADAVLHYLESPSGQQLPRIIDIALLRKLRSGSIRIRVVEDLTRPLTTGSISIVSAVCGLLFPLNSLLSHHAGTPLAASFGSFVLSDDELDDMRTVGHQLPNGTTSIMLICWSSAAPSFVAALANADQITRRTFGELLSNDIGAVLSTDANITGLRQRDKSSHSR